MTNKNHWLKAMGISLAIHVVFSLFVMINFMGFDKNPYGPIAFAFVFAILLVYSLVVSLLIGWAYSKYKNRNL